MGISVKDALSRRYANSTNRSNRYEDQEEEEKSNGGVSVNEALSRWKINTKVQETPLQYANPQKAQQNQVQTPVLDASKAAAAERAKRREEKRQAAGVALPSSATNAPVTPETDTSGLRAMSTGSVKQVGGANLSDEERARIEQENQEAEKQAESGRGFLGIDLLQKGAWEGYNPGKVTDVDSFFKEANEFNKRLSQTSLGTIGDVGLNVLEGGLNTIEGFTDLGGYAASALHKLFGADEAAQKIKEDAQQNTISKWLEPATNYLEQYSVFGETPDAVAQAGGQYLAQLGIGKIAQGLGAGEKALTVINKLFNASSAFGRGMSEAFNDGATDGEAVAYGAISAIAEVCIEMLFSGKGSKGKKLGVDNISLIKIGEMGLDDWVASKVGTLVENPKVRNVVQGLVKNGFEGLSEFLTGAVQGTAKLIYEDEKSWESWKKIMKDENLSEQALVGFMISLITQAPDVAKANKTGTDLITGEPTAATSPTQGKNTEQTATEAVQGEKAAQEAQTPTAEQKAQQLLQGLPGQQETQSAQQQAQEGAETSALPQLPQTQEQAQTQEQEQAAPQQMTPADEAALKLAQLTETKDYPGTETKVEPVEVQQQTEQQLNEQTMQHVDTQAEQMAEEQPAQQNDFAMGAADKGFDPYSSLQYEYGNKPDRNGTVRGINVPNKDSYGRRVSDTPANLYGNKITETDQMVEEIERRIVEGDFGADVKSTTETIERATNEILAKNGDTKVTAQIVSAVAEGRTSDELVAKAMSMYTYLQQQSRFEEAGEMAVYLSDLLRTAGRTLNIAKMTSKLTPEGQWAARQAIYRKADKKANSGKKAKRTNIAPSAKMEQEFKDVATAEETAVTETGEELKRHLRGDAEKAAKKAASNAEAAIKKADRQAKKAADDGEKSDLDKAVESGLKAGKNAAKAAMQTETPTQDEVYSAIMDFINSKKKKLGNKQNKERSLRTLLEYYKNNDNFQQAWWAARRQADLTVSGDEQARAILDEFLYSADAMMEGDELLEGSVARKAAKEAAKGAGVDLGKLVTGTREEKTKAEIAVNQYVQSKYESTDENAKGMTRSVANAFRAEMEQRRDAIFDKDGAARDVMRKAVKESGYQLSSLLTATHKEKQAALEKAQEYVGDHYTFYWEQRNKYSDMVASEFYSELARRRDDVFAKDGGSRAVMRKAATETEVKLSDMLTATQAEKQAALDGITKWISEHYNLPGEEADMLSDLTAEEYYSELTERRNEKLKDDAGKRRVMRRAAKETGVTLSDLLTESLQNKQEALESIQEYVQEHYAMPIEDAAVLAKSMQDAFFTDLAERQAKRLEAMFAPKEQTAKPTPKDTAQKLREFAALGAYNEYGDINRESLKRLFGTDGLQLSPELMEHYADISDARRAEVDARIVQDIADQLPGDLAQSFRKLRYGMMLINPSSHENNIIGSFGQSTIQLLGRDNLSAIIQSIAKKATGGKFKPTRALLNWASEADRKLFQMGMQDYGTIMHNNGEVANRIANGNRYDIMRDEVEQARRVMKFKGESKPVQVINKVLGAAEWVLDANSKLMGFEDAPFGRNAYAASVAMYMKANGLTEITTEARDFAIEQAQICTLHDDSVLFQLLKKHLPKTVVDAEVPFLKSVANIADRMFTYSPGGFVKFGNDLLKMAMYKNGDTDVAKQMQKKYTWAKAIDDFSAGTVGALLVFTGMALANAGLIRVNGTGSDEEREYEELMGAKPNSAYIGGKWWDASNFSPFSASLFTGAAIYENMVNAAEGNGSWEDILSAAFSISDPMLDMSVFSGLDGLMYAIRYAPEDQPLAATITAELITSYLNQHNSSFLRKFAYALDNKSRKAYNDGIISSAVQEYEAQVPGLRSNVSQKYDIWGQPFAHNAIGGDDPLSIGLRTVSPFRAYDTHETEIDEELKRLMALGYDVLPSANNSKSIAVKRIDENGDEISEKVKLTAEQYDIYQRVEGQASLEMAKLIMQSELFKELPDEWKAKALNEGYEHTDGLGKEAALSEYEYELPAWLDGKKGVTEEVANAILEKVQKDYAGLGDTAFKKASDFGFSDEQASEMTTIVERYENLHKGESANNKYRAILENTSGADRYKWLQVYGMTENQVEEMQDAQKYGIGNEQYLDLRDYATAQHQSGNTKWDVSTHVNLVKAGLSDATAKTVQTSLDAIKGENKNGSASKIQKLETITDLGNLTGTEKEKAVLYVLDDSGDAKYEKLKSKHQFNTDKFVDVYRAYLDGDGKKASEKAGIARALGTSADADIVEAIWKVYEGK